MAPDPHTAVKRELLVRYLDFWTPAATGSGRRTTYLDASPYGAAAAVRVFTEFADLLAGRELWLLVDGDEPPADPAIEGLHVAAAPADPAGAVSGGPALAHLDRGAAHDALVAALGAARAGELVLVTEPEQADPRQGLYAAGFEYAVAVELVDEAGAAQLLRFATSNLRSLERFKDELWAVDQYAGVRYRDPAEPDAVPLDISLEPHPGPLRRALMAYLATGQPCTVDDLRGYALARTLYRPADVVRALSPLLARGALAREPERGRLSGATLVRLAG